MRFFRKCLRTGCIKQKTTIKIETMKRFEQKPKYKSSAKIIAEKEFEIESSNETLINSEQKSEKIASKTRDNEIIKSLSLVRFMKLLKQSNHQVYYLYLKDKFEKKLDRYQKKILTAAIVEAVRQNDHKKFMQSKPEYLIQDLKLQVSRIYHSEIEIFNQKKVDEFFFHRKEDHEIVLTSRIESFFIKSYKSISEQELTAIKKYLDEHLEKKFIRFSSSKATVSVLFVKKSSESLRFCVDYRELNEIIEKHRYSISLINETFTRLSKAFVLSN